MSVSGIFSFLGGASAFGSSGILQYFIAAD